MPAENEGGLVPNEMTSMNGTTDSQQHGSIQHPREPAARNGNVPVSENRPRTVGEGPVDVWIYQHEELEKKL